MLNQKIPILIIIFTNILLFTFSELRVFLIVIFFEVLVFILMKKYFEKKSNLQIQENTTNETPQEIDVKNILNFIDQYSYPVFILANDFDIYYQNPEATRLYGDNKNAAMGMMIFYTNAAVRIVYVLITKKILVRFQDWRVKTT